jgi:hypothetical protein
LYLEDEGWVDRRYGARLDDAAFAVAASESDGFDLPVPRFAPAVSILFTRGILLCYKRKK